MISVPFLLIWLFLISSILNVAKKKARQADQRRQQAEANPWEQLQQRAPGQAGQALRPAAPKPVAPAPVQMSMSMPLPADMPAGTFAPLAPTVHTHLEPACETHDAPGSLDYVSTEGIDICHEEQFDPRPELIPQQSEQPGIRLNLDSGSLVQAFVLQEVLTRPCDRRPRGYAKSI